MKNCRFSSAASAPKSVPSVGFAKQGFTRTAVGNLKIRPLSEHGASTVHMYLVSRLGNWDRKALLDTSDSEYSRTCK